MNYEMSHTVHGLGNAQTTGPEKRKMTKSGSKATCGVTIEVAKIILGRSLSYIRVCEQAKTPWRQSIESCARISIIEAFNR